MLSDDIMLNIFRYCLSITPRIWPTLVRVCHKWRQIVLASPLSLNLRLHCTHGTPVLEALNCCIALPIVVQYGGAPNLNPPAPEDDDNIIAALKQSDRVSSISLTVTSTLIEKLSAISEPLSELEELVLMSQDNAQLTFPSTFLWGPHIHTLHLTRIAFPSLVPLLSPCQAIVDLQLHEIPGAGYFPPEEFANALSGMSQLRSLSLHLLSFPRRRSYLDLPAPPEEHIVLPALTLLKYRGISKYLDNLVARIDAPLLGDIDITFFSQPTMDALQLGRFIERIGMQTLLSQADVVAHSYAISISLFNTSAPQDTPLRIQISCKQLDWQLSCMAQVCDRISPFLSRVITLGINTAQSLGGKNDGNSEPWLDLLRSFKFSGVECFSVDSEVTTDILRVLGLANERNLTMLPSLRLFDVDKNIEMVGPSWDSVQSFITSRSIFGRPVDIHGTSYQCHICYASGYSSDAPGLKRHLREKHRYKVLCSYCGEFECTPGQSDLFPKHLKDKHPKIAHNDIPISEPSLTVTQMNDLVNRHTSLRAPDVVPPPPTSESTELASLPAAWDSDLDSSDSDPDQDSGASDW